jgi:hypothetical protein
MRAGAHFDVEFEAVGDAATVRKRTEHEADVLAFANANLKPNSELCVACIGDGVDYGNLIIEVDEKGNCTVRSHEHQGFIVTCIPQARALDALEYWLSSQGRMPSLEWLDQ